MHPLGPFEGKAIIKKGRKIPNVVNMYYSYAKKCALFLSRITIFIKKKSGFVGSGFVKACDELVIGQHLHPLVPSQPVEILRRDYTITTQAATRILTQLQKEHPPPAVPPPPRPPPPLPTCPHFVVELNDIVLQEGDSCELNVQVQGEPLPKITWFKDGVAVQDNNKVKR